MEPHASTAFAPCPFAFAHCPFLVWPDAFFSHPPDFPGQPIKRTIQSIHHESCHLQVPWLHCHIQGRIKDDGNHVCGGLLNHLKQGPNKGKGRHKNNGKRNLGSLTCLGVYQSRSLVSPEGEIDISTSIEDESLSE